MQPTNKSERRKALLNFMLLFLVCTGIIVTTVFFSTRVHLKQNDELLKYKNSVLKNNNTKIEFTKKLISVSVMIDSLDHKKQTEISDADFRIDEGIKKLKIMSSEVEDEIDNNFYSTATKNLLLYHAAKKAVRGNDDKNANEKELNDRLAAANKKVEDYYLKLVECMSSKKQ